MLASLSPILHSHKRCFTTLNPFINLLKLSPSITSSFPYINSLHISANHFNNDNNNTINVDTLDLNRKYKKELLELKKTLKQRNERQLLSYKFKSVIDASTSPNTWHTVLQTNWPVIQSFEGKSTKKSLSEALAAKQLIDYYKSCLKLEVNNNNLAINNNHLEENLDKQYSKENHQPSQTKSKELVENLKNTNLTKEEITNLKLRYPLAKQIIKTIFNQVKTELTKNETFKIIYTQDNETQSQLWKCTIHWWWPHHNIFEAYGQNKTEALTYNSLQILSWLEKKNLITEKGVPKFILEKSYTPQISLKEEELKSIPKVINTYFKDPPENHLPLITKNNEITENLKSFNLTREEISNLKIRYPKAKESIHNISVQIASQLKKKQTPLNITYSIVNEAKLPLWKCTIHWQWPEPFLFEGFGRNKSDANTYASLRALTWLEQNKIITKNGYPLLKTTSFTSDICLKEEDFVTIPSLINKYFDEIETCMEETPVEDEKSSTFSEESESTEISPYMKESIDKYLLNKAQTNRYSQIENLPISKFRNEINSAIKSNRVLVVEGEPGCGKSTQVPQYIFDELALDGAGSDCRILITQPRRISAISLAHRIAEERNERIGDVVGYKVRFDAIYPEHDHGSILFCTTGILLKHLINNPSLKGLSHVIIDEVHERDCNTDMILALIEQALHLNQDLKLILMSATINSQMFVDFFKKADLTTASIKLPGFTYPVKSFYIDKKENKIENLRINNEIQDTEMDVKSLNINLIVETIQHIHNSRPLNGAILVFLPGWSDISKVKNNLEKGLNSRNFLILPIHSRLRSRDQRQIFDKPPPETRKIILATNIAESSITINDVVYVVDTGVHKEYRYSDLGVSILSNHWISKASAKQRKGRAGRVQSGECFHLYTQDELNAMDDFPVPEIHRVLLTKIILDSKTYAPHIPVESFLQRLPEPPNHESIRIAKNMLIDMDALDENESLTKLGKILSSFSCDPTISKTLVHAVLFRCISPIMTIASIIEGDLQLFINDLYNRGKIREIKARKDNESDHLACAHVYEEWANAQKNRNDYEIRRLCQDNCLSPNVLENVRNYRLLFSRNIQQNNLCANNKEPMVNSSPCNQFYQESELVKAILYSGLNNLLEHRGKGRYSNVSSNVRRPANISSESVNFKKDKHSRFYTYYKIMNITNRFGIIHETSSLSPLAVLLFSSGKILSRKVKQDADKDPQEELLELKITSKEKLFIYCNRRTCDLLMHLRTIMWKTKEYLMVQESDNNIQNENYQKVREYFDELLPVIVKLLNSHAKQQTTINSDSISQNDETLEQKQNIVNNNE